MVERKNAQDALSKSELLFRQFAENIKEVFWRTNSTMDRTIYMSTAYEEIWGHTVESCYANPQQWFDAIVPEDQPIVKETFDQLRHNKISSVSLEFRIMRSDGALRNIYTRGFRMEDEQGKLLSLLGISSDITDYQRAKERSKIQRKIVNILKTSTNINTIFSKVLKRFALLLIWI